MNKTATNAKTPPLQASLQLQPAQKPPKGFDKAAWDRKLNFEIIKSFTIFSAEQPHLATKAEIAEALQAAREILPDPYCDHEQKREIRYLLFHTFAKISISTKDEEARRAAEAARDSIPYPFSPRYGRVLGQP